MEGGEYVKKSFVFLLATCLFAIVPSVTHAQSLFSKPVNLFNQLGIPNLLSNVTTEAHTEVVTNEGPVQANNAISADNEMQAAEVSAPTNPLLIVNLLGANLNLLGQDSSNNHASLRLDLNDPLKIDQHPSEDTISGGSLLDVGLNLPVVGNVNLDLLSNANQAASDEGLSSNDGILGLGINDSLLLGDLNLVVLPQSQDTQGNESEGLATIDFDNMLGNTHVGVMEENTNLSGENTSVSGSLVAVDSKDSPIGDVHVGVGEVTKTETPDFTQTDAGLIHVDVKTPVTGDTQIGVLDSQQKETSDGKTISGGLVNVDAQDSPIGDVHASVGEVTQTKTSDSTQTDAGLIHVGVDNPVTGETQIDVLNTQQKQTDEGTTVSGGVVSVDTKDSPIGDTHIGVGEVKPEEPTAPDDANKPADPTPSEGTTTPTDSTTTPTDSTTPETAPTQEPTTPVVSTSNDGTAATSDPTPIEVTTPVVDETTKNESAPAKETNTEELNQIDGSADSQNASSKFTENTLPATENIIQNTQTQEKNVTAAELKKDLDAAGNNTANSPVQVIAPAGSTTAGSSAGSGSGAGGSSSSGGGFGMSMYLGNEYLREIDLKNQVQSILKELSDEWIKAPPIDPPQGTFFLSE